MLNNFGKFCRKIRIEEGKLLYEMACELGVSSAFLSKVENGKAKPQEEWEEIIAEKYNLKEEDRKKLKEFINEARTSTLKLDDFNSEKKDMVLAFARKFEGLSIEERNQIRKILR